MSDRKIAFLVDILFVAEVSCVALSTMVVRTLTQTHYSVEALLAFFLGVLLMVLGWALNLPRRAQLASMLFVVISLVMLGVYLSDLLHYKHGSLVLTIVGLYVLVIMVGELKKYRDLVMTGGYLPESTLDAIAFVMSDLCFVVFVGSLCVVLVAVSLAGM